jgi:hypothetical protein
MTSWIRLATMASLAFLCGCPDTAVFVDASIENGNLAMTQSTLSTGVSGSFDLRLHLGDRASGSSQVDLLGFSIVNGAAELVDPVGATTDPAFPVNVAVDSDVVVRFTLAADDNLVENTMVDALCAAPGAVIRGAVNDALRDGSVDVSSMPIPVSGCP